MTWTGLQIWYAFQAIVFVASVSYQVRQSKKLRDAIRAAEEARKGFELVVEGEIRPLPIVYGRALIGGARCYHNVSSAFKYITPNSNLVLNAGRAAIPARTVQTFNSDTEGNVTTVTVTLDPIPANDLTASATGSKNEFLYFQQAMCQEPINAVYDVIIDNELFLDDQSIANSTYGVVYRNGSFAQDDTASAAIRLDFHYEGRADNIIKENFPERASAVFTNAAHLSGVVQLDRDQPQFSKPPDVQALIEGRKIRPVLLNAGVYSLSNTRVYSTNPAFCLLDYLLDATSGKALSINQIDLKSFYDAAQVCATIVQTNAAVGGKIWNPTKNTRTPVFTRDLPLYECNIVIDVSKPVRENVEKILGTMGDARLVWSQGRYKLILQYPTSNANIILAGTLTDNDLLNSDQIEVTWPSINDRYNNCTVRFSNESLNFKEDSVSWPPKINGFYTKGLGGVRYTALSGWGADNDLPYVDLLNNFAVWKGNNPEASVMTWKFIPKETGVYVLKAAGDDNINFVMTQGATVVADFTEVWRATKTLNLNLTANLEYTITITGSNPALPNNLGGFVPNNLFGVAATLTNPTNLLEWSTRSEAYTSFVSYNVSNEIYLQMLKEDNDIKLENDLFAEGITDYYHALAKAEEIVRTSRTAFTVSFKYIIKDKYFEPGDIIKLNSETLKLGVDTDLYLKIDEVKVEDGAICKVTATRFDYQQLAWNQKDNEYIIPPNQYFFNLTPPSSLTYVPQNTSTANSPGILEWPEVSDSSVLGYILYFARGNNLSSTNQLIFDEIGRVRKPPFIIPDLGRVSGFFGVRAFNAKGVSPMMANSQTTAVALWTAFIPPNPTTLTATVVGDLNNAVSLNWVIPTTRPGTGGLAYEDHYLTKIYRNNVEIGTSFNNTYTDLPEIFGNLTYKVKLFSTRDLPSQFSNNASVSVSAPSVLGLKTATVYAYKRSASNVTDNPGQVTYSFSSFSITSALANGWSGTIPSGSDNLYICAATAAESDNDLTDIILANEWSTPSLFVEKGGPGLSSATVILYRRTTTNTAPTVAIDGTEAVYEFATGLLASPPANWTTTIPDISQGEFLWIVQATASGFGSTDTIPDSQWSVPKLLSSPSYNISLNVYRKSETDLGAADRPQNATYNFNTKLLTFDNQEHESLSSTLASASGAIGSFKLFDITTDAFNIYYGGTYSLTNLANGSDTFFYIYKTDLFNNPIWRKRYRITNFNSLVNSIFLNVIENDLFVLVGHTNTSNSEKRCSIYELDLNGNILAQQLLSETQIEPLGLEVTNSVYISLRKTIAPFTSFLLTMSKNLTVSSQTAISLTPRNSVAALHKPLLLKSNTSTAINYLSSHPDSVPSFSNLQNAIFAAKFEGTTRQFFNEYVDTTVERSLEGGLITAAVDKLDNIHAIGEVASTGGDLFFDNTSLLLHMNQGPVSTTFVDSSSTPKLISRIGNALASTEQIKFGASSYKGGAGLGLSIPYNTSLDLINSNWCIEGWSYNTATSGFGTIIDFRGTAAVNTSWGLFFNYTNRSLNLYDGPTNTTVLFTSANACPLNVWFHWAVVRNGSIVTMYINGLSSASIVYNSPATNASGLRIGLNQASTDFLVGYLDDLRITKNSSRYISNFTPPNEPFPDISGADPFFPNVLVQLDFNGTNGSQVFTDSSSFNRTVNRSGDSVSISTAQFVFGGASGLFNGAQLFVNDNGSEFNLGTGDFCIESFIFPTGTYGTPRNIISKFFPSFPSGLDLILELDTSGRLSFLAGTNVQISIQSNSSIPLNVWTHVAVTRASGVTRLFVNGILQTATHTGSVSIVNNRNSFYFGSNGFNANYFLGYIDQLRITKGAARYTSTFKLTTTLLYNQEVLLDSPSLYYRMNETSGTVADDIGSINSDGSYTGGFTLNQPGFVSNSKSVLFGGAANHGRLISGSSTNFTSSCSIECWARPSSSGHGTDAVGYVIAKNAYYAEATNDFPMAIIWRPSSNRFEFRLSNSIDFNIDTVLQSDVLSPEQDYHLVGVYRANGLCEFYVNGSLVASATISYSISTNTRFWTIGNATPFSVPASNGAFAGRIGEVAIYNFPLSAFRIGAHYASRNGISFTTAKQPYYLKFDTNGNLSVKKFLSFSSNFSVNIKSSLIYNDNFYFNFTLPNNEGYIVKLDLNGVFIDALKFEFTGTWDFSKFLIANNAILLPADLSGTIAEQYVARIPLSVASDVTKNYNKLAVTKLSSYPNYSEVNWTSLVNENTIVDVLNPSLSLTNSSITLSSNTSDNSDFPIYYDKETSSASLVYTLNTGTSYSTWYPFIPEGTGLIYISTGTVKSSESIGSILNTEWTFPRLLADRGDSAVYVSLLQNSDLVLAAPDGSGFRLPTGNQIALYQGSSKITSGVSYGPATTSKNGLRLDVNKDTGVIQYLEDDPYFNNVVLLLLMEGVNNGTTFTDSSSFAKVVTPEGNAVTRTNIAKFGTSSAFFDGAGDLLSLASSSDWQFLNGDFTVEGFFNASSNTSTGHLVGQWSTTTSVCSWHIGLIANGGLFIELSTNGLYQPEYSITSATGLFSINVWNHFAFVRRNNIFTVYLNGTSVLTLNAAITLFNSNAILGIGAISVNAAQPFNGHLDEIRITKGIARYTSNFIPNNVSLTEIIPGDTNFNNVALLLRGEGANGSTVIVDSSTFNRAVTANNGAAVSTVQARFGSASLFFDGVNDYLQIADANEFDFPGDFTIEMWVYPTTTGTSRGLFIHRAVDTSGTGTLALGISSSNALAFTNLQTVVVTSGGTVAQNAWSHIAVSRLGANLFLFVNGVQVATRTDSTNFTNTNPVYIGFDRAAGGALPANFTDFFAGYIDELRVTKGVARYSVNFSVPSREFPAYIRTSSWISDSETFTFNATYNGNIFPVNYTISKLKSNIAVDLLSESDVIAANENGLNYTLPAANKLTLYSEGRAIVSNVTYSVTTATVDGLTATIDTSGNITLSGAAWTSSTASFNFVATYGGVQYSARYTISKSLRGNSSVQAVLISEADIVPATNAGVVTTLPSNNFIQLYQGGSVVTSGVTYGTPAVDDPFFSNVILLLHMDGANNSTTFIDSSPTPKVATLSGTAVVSTSVFRYGTGSFFSDVNGHLNFSDSVFNLNTGDFTIEAWINSTSGGATRNIVATASSTSNGLWYFSLSSSSKVQFLGYGDIPSVIGTTTILNNTWYHVAVSRNGSTLRIFVNGVQDAINTSFSGNLLAFNGTGLAVGGWYNGTSRFQGYLDEVRITKGVGRYTANFTPPNAPFPDTSPTSPDLRLSVNSTTGQISLVDTGWNTDSKQFTVYATFNSIVYNKLYTISKSKAGSSLFQAVLTRDIDLVEANSNGVVTGTLPSNNFIKLYQGSSLITSGVTYGPPPVSEDPLFSNVSGLWHAEGANNSTTTLDITNQAPALVGVSNAVISTIRSKFGVSSISIPNLGARFTCAVWAGCQFGTQDFTIEFWFYLPTATASSDGRILSMGSWNAAGSWMIDKDNTQGISFLSQTSGVASVSGSFLSVDQWNHIAVCRSGTSVNIYINGVLRATGSSSTNFNASGDFRVGTHPVDSAFRPYFVDELRLTKGIARYTANFTPPTAPFPDTGPISDLKLSVNSTTGQISLVDTGWNTDSKQFTVYATLNSINYEKVYNVSKVKGGATGQSNYRIYKAAPFNSAPATPAAGPSVPPATWSSTPVTINAGEAQWQSDGVQPVGSANITWNTPYQSYLKVDELEAITTNTGNLIVSKAVRSLDGLTNQPVGFAGGNGFFLGKDVDTFYKFKVGNTGGGLLSFDGSRLQLLGNIQSNYIENVLSSGSGISVIESVSNINNNLTLRSIKAGAGLSVSTANGEVVLNSNEGTTNYIALSADQQFTSTTTADVSGFFLPLEANKLYYIEGTIRVKTPAISTGVKIGCKTPYNATSGGAITTLAALANTSVSGIQRRTAHSQLGGECICDFTDHWAASVSDTSVFDANAFSIISIEATVKTGSIAGVFQITAGTEVGGSAVTIGEGSMIYIRELAKQSVAPSGALVASPAGIPATFSVEDIKFNSIAAFATATLVVKNDGTWRLTGTGVTTQTGSWVTPANSTSAANFDVFFDVVSTSGTVGITRSNEASSYTQVASDKSYTISSSTPGGLNESRIGNTSIALKFRDRSTSTATLMQTILLTAKSESYSGGSGNVINPLIFGSGSYVSTKYGSALATTTLSVLQNGSWTVTVTSDIGEADGAGSWYSPATGTPGNAFWVKFTRNSGTSNSTPTTGWLQLNSTRSVTVTAQAISNSVFEDATYTVQIASDSSGTTIVSSGTVMLEAKSLTGPIP